MRDLLEGGMLVLPGGSVNFHDSQGRHTLDIAMENAVNFGSHAGISSPFGPPERLSEWLSRESPWEPSLTKRSCRPKARINPIFHQPDFRGHVTSAMVRMA